jgi:hypothetical protein
MPQRRWIGGQKSDTYVQFVPSAGDLLGWMDSPRSSLVVAHMPLPPGAAFPVPQHEDGATSIVELLLNAWLESGTSRAGLASKKLPDTESARRSRVSKVSRLTWLQGDHVRLHGHDGEVLHPRDVGQRKGVPEDDVGVVHVVAAAGKVLETLGVTIGLVGVLSRGEQLAILVRGDPDVVLGEVGAFGDDAVSPGQSHLARVGHQLV